jgi:NAD(P)-dependent dehydrogenase (short-subunit alcohol dehydrogenase family)
MKSAPHPRTPTPRVAVVFAATGAISRGVARAFAREGSTVWLAGRDQDRTDAVAAELRGDHPEATVQAACVDATDAGAVGAFLDRVLAEAGRIDAVFNGIGGRPAELAYPKPIVETSVDDFLLPLARIAGSQFLTAREAGRRMAAQPGGGGAIVTLSATLSGMTPRNMAGITATCGAVEAMTRALAGDFGAHGIRVNCVRGSAMPETRTIQETFAGQSAIMGEPSPMAPPPLGRPITVDETAATAVFLASPAASGITGQVVTVCAGQFVG